MSEGGWTNKLICPALYPGLETCLLSAIQGTLDAHMIKEDSRGTTCTQGSREGCQYQTITQLAQSMCRVSLRTWVQEFETGLKFWLEES